MAKSARRKRESKRNIKWGFLPIPKRESSMEQADSSGKPFSGVFETPRIMPKAEMTMQSYQQERNITAWLNP